MYKILFFVLVISSLVKADNVDTFLSYIDSVDCSKKLKSYEIKKDSCYLYSEGFYRYFERKLNPWMIGCEIFYKIEKIHVIDIRNDYVRYEIINEIKVEYISSFIFNVRKCK